MASGLIGADGRASVGRGAGETCPLQPEGRQKADVPEGLRGGSVHSHREVALLSLVQGAGLSTGLPQRLGRRAG